MLSPSELLEYNELDKKLNDIYSIAQPNEVYFRWLELFIKKEANNAQSH